MSLVYIFTDVTPFHGHLTDLNFLSSSPHEKKISPFYVLLTVRPVKSLGNNQIYAQFFLYVYFYSLHISGSHVPIIRAIIVAVRHLVHVTLCR